MRTILLFAILASKLCVAQQSCPEGYELRKVKCNGHFVEKCLPANKKCSLCWIVQYPPCAGNKTGGTTLHNSYQSAEKSALAEIAEIHSRCFFFDNRSYTIYTDDCPTDVLADNAVTKDVKNKIIPFLKRYKAEITNYRRYLNGQPYKPGAVYKEYETILKQAEKNAENLSIHLVNMNEQNIEDIEAEFEKLKEEENSLIAVDTKYRSAIAPASKNSSTIPGPATSSRIAPTVSNDDDNAAKTRQTVNKQEDINRVLENMNRQREISDRNFQSVQNGLATLSDQIQTIFSQKYIRLMQISRENAFENLQHRVRDGEYELQTCDKCNGSGTLDHASCKGTGKVTCISCNGTGKGFTGSACGLCIGRGYNYCIQGCSGTGVILCDQCSGSGMTLTEKGPE